MTGRDPIEEETTEFATNEGYVQAHEHRQDLERRADAAISGPSLEERKEALARGDWRKKPGE